MYYDSSDRINNPLARLHSKSPRPCEAALEKAKMAWLALQVSHRETQGFGCVGLQEEPRPDIFLLWGLPRASLSVVHSGPMS